MSLPQFKSHYYTQKQIYEENLARKKNFDEQYRQQWSDKANYFKKNSVALHKFNQWSSERGFTTSIEAYKKQRAQVTDYKENLEKRRMKLIQLINDEAEQYKAELKQDKLNTGATFNFMKTRAEALKSAREDERKKEAEKLYYEHFRLNNPDLRKVESELNNQSVIEAWPQQIQEKEIAKLELYDDDRRYDEIQSARQKEETEREKEEFQDKVVRERAIKDSLRRQIDEMKEREDKARYLKQLEEQLMLEREYMNEIEYNRSLESERSKKKEYGRTLLRQHAAALRRRSHEIQKEMEEDIRFLYHLTEKDNMNRELQSARREKAVQDVNWMRDEMERQLRREREREIELDDMFAEEAARLWNKRESEWEKEKKARENLMQQVLEERRHQIESKLEENRQRQYQTLQEREDILRQLEQEKFELHNEQLQTHRQQSGYRDDLKKQIQKDVYYKQQLESARAQREFQEEQDEERFYQELIRQEAEKMRLEGPRNIRSARR